MNEFTDNRLPYAQNPKGRCGEGGDFVTPPQEKFDNEEMMGSIQSILARNVNQFVVIEFLIGTAEIVRKHGVLCHVGTSYVTLYDETSTNFIVCDIFSIKFVHFYMPGNRPRTNPNIVNPRQGR